MCEFTLALQSRIIITCVVGLGYAERQVDWEADDGSMSKVSLVVAITRILAFAM